MKKIIAMLALVSITVSSMITPVYADINITIDQDLIDGAVNKMTELVETGIDNMNDSFFELELPEKLPTRAEFAKIVIELFNIALEEVPENSEVDEYTYTALKKGVFKGVSFEFSGKITEEEVKTIQSNLSSLFGDLVSKNDQTEASEESIVRGDKVFEFETEWGTIKKPTDLNVNDKIWTDDEFHNLLIGNPKMFNRGKIARSNEDAKTAEYWGEQWYYNMDSKHIMLRGKVVGKHDDGEDLYNYVDLDQATNGRAFSIMKALQYHAQKHNMNLQFMPDPHPEQLRVRISEKDHGGGNIIFLISYAPEKRERRYSQIEGYDSSVNPVETEWMISSLWDWNIYSDRGLDIDDFTPQEHREYIISHNFADQNYSDFLYGICDYIYEDGVDVYRAMMTAHIQEQYEFFNDIEDEYDFRMVETDHQEIYIFDQKIHADIYGITLGK